MAAAVATANGFNTETKIIVTCANGEIDSSGTTGLFFYGDDWNSNDTYCDVNTCDDPNTGSCLGCRYNTATSGTCITNDDQADYNCDFSNESKKITCNDDGSWSVITYESNNCTSGAVSYTYRGQSEECVDSVSTATTATMSVLAAAMMLALTAKNMYDRRDSSLISGRCDLFETQ